MNEEKIDVFRHLIEERLRPLVNSDYVFIDLPYHANVGDARKQYLPTFLS